MIAKVTTVDREVSDWEWNEAARRSIRVYAAATFGRVSAGKNLADRRRRLLAALRDAGCEAESAEEFAAWLERRKCIVCGRLIRGHQTGGAPRDLDRVLGAKYCTQECIGADYGRRWKAGLAAGPAGDPTPEEIAAACAAIRARKNHAPQPDGGGPSIGSPRERPVSTAYLRATLSARRED